MIHTTNIIVSFYRLLWEVITTGAFANDEALLKGLYLVQEEVT